MDLLYLQDSYLKEFEATVVSVSDNHVVLDKTAFYPTSGGQPHDTGVLVRSDEEFPVVSVLKSSGAISHELGRTGLAAGDHVTGRIDWNRRYTLMRYHTAAHLLSEIIHNRTGAKITGNQLGLDKARIDFDLETFDREKIKSFETEANEVIATQLPVKKYFLPREEAVKNPSLFQLKNVLPPEVEQLRIVEIVGLAVSACGGCHVDNVREIGRIEIVSAENKGKNNRRIVFALKDLAQVPPHIPMKQSL